jgi:hypothetical protein
MIRGYTSRATWKLIEEILESADLYGPAMDWYEEHGDYDAQTIKKLCEYQSSWVRTLNLDTVDWGQVAEEINANLSGKVVEPTKVYIVMSTHDNESEYTVHGVYRSEASAYKVEGELQTELDDGENLEEDMESPWHVWIEERELEN